MATLLGALLAIGAAPAPRAAGRSPAYAVVVHPSTAVSDVSLPQLRRIFLGEQRLWPGGGHVMLFVAQPGDGARTVTLRRLYQMSESTFKRYWTDRTLRDRLATGPKLVSSAGMARRLTAAIPGAVAVVPLADVDRSVKVLRIDGRGPADVGYLLAAER